MNHDLTRGPIMGSMLRFAVPMILGNLLQQCYNVADTLIVGRFLGPNALAAVGSSFTLMTFLTSILIGLCMGSGTVFSIRFGEGDEDGLKEGMWASFVLIAGLAVLFRVSSAGGRQLRGALVFSGRLGSAEYSAGSVVCDRTEHGSGRRGPGHRPVPVCVGNRNCRLRLAVLSAAEAEPKALPPSPGLYPADRRFFCHDLPAAVGDESGNPDGPGTGQQLWSRDHGGLCRRGEDRFLRIEGAFYCGIGCLFLLYGLYRALGKPEMSLILTIISLGTRVVLAYLLSAVPAIGVVGIWWAVPIGWFLADTFGIVYYLRSY